MSFILKEMFKMKKIILFCSLVLSNACFAQAPAPQAPVIPLPSYQQKFALFGTNQLTQVNTSLESKKNKNFVIDFKSLLAGNDLKNAEEHDLNVKYGIKSMFGGVLSANMNNTKSYGLNKDNEYYGLSYALASKNSSFNFSFKSSDTTQTQYKGMATQIYQLDLKAKF